MSVRYLHGKTIFLGIQVPRTPPFAPHFLLLQRRSSVWLRRFKPTVGCRGVQGDLDQSLSQRSLRADLIWCVGKSTASPFPQAQDLHVENHYFQMGGMCSTHLYIPIFSSATAVSKSNYKLIYTRFKVHS